MSNVEISNPIDLILCDSSPLVLSAMSETFEQDSRFSLVATSSTSEGFLATILRIEVQICIIDWNIRDLSAEKLINLLRSQSIPPRTIIYGEGSDPDIARQAMGAGAAAFVSRSAPIETLIQTCLDVAAGKMVFPFLDIRDLRNDPINTLSRKEKVIIEALSEGLTNKQLSARLQISSNTVKFHISNIFDKLNVTNRAQAIAHYYKSKSTLNE
jgi:two-component system nitrate/nitrite response regulator NarP